MTGYATLPGGQAASGWISEVPTVSTDHVIQLANGLVCADSPAVTDIDGNVYPVVSIGGQCWMAENLRTTRYRDGAEIPNVTDATAWSDLETGAWSNYDNDTVNDASTASSTTGSPLSMSASARKGWHVPTDADWQSGTGGHRLARYHPQRGWPTEEPLALDHAKQRRHQQQRFRSTARREPRQ
ncbi:MAG: fibrobacter succinogenes major paralogous domain-containing protein [Flavobacteriales bacterium]|nr:fibrobacter succinogenes major paralogous domain-containing protein [Flavobacteriales bacterium]